jgi:ribosomal protein S6
MNDTNSENENVIYEIGYHLLPIVEESEVPTNSLKIKSIIEENGGMIISEEMPKMIVLAYDITRTVNSKKQKFSKAYFGWVKFEADPAKISDIKNKIESDQNMLRFLVVKTVKENTMHVPKIPMFRKENNREERAEEHVETPKASEEEIDKSIDELVIDQTL